MSGLEAAGLVLGAIPIIIWSLEKYKTTREIWRRSRNKALLVDRMINTLQEQQFLIKADLQILLRTAGVEDVETSGMDRSYYREHLVKPRITKALMRYLGPAYHVYRNRLSTCERILAEIAQNVRGLTAQTFDPKSPQNYLAGLIETHSTPTEKFGWREAGQKIKFALKKDELDRLIAELDASTSMLRKVHVAGAGMQHDDPQFLSSRTIEKLSIFLNKIQRYSSPLYSAIAGGCSLSCHDMHRFKLYLEDRSAPLLRKKTQISFRVECNPIPNSAPPEECYCAHVEAVDEEQTQQVEAAGQSKSQRIPTVAFALLEDKPPARERVRDLCAVFREPTRAKKPLSLYLSESGLFTSVTASIDAGVSEISPNPTTDILTLETIIQKAYDSRSIAIRWSVNQRMLLAYRLSSLLPQFHSSPWLGGSLRKDSICFSGTEAETLSFNAHSPFIAHNFHATGISQATAHSSVKACLLDLGILLLEIWHITPFEEYIAREGLQVNNTYGSRYEVARQWLDDTADNILPFYMDSTCRCIEGTFASTSPTLQWTDRQFQISMCEGLIKPLFDNCLIKAT
ncbi:MAG: hypothetical protein Q9197_001414 [Variospora fuerteventurae]